MGWLEQLEQLVTRTHSPIGMCGDVPNPLNRWLIKGTVHEPQSPFGDPVVDPSGRVVFPWEFAAETAETLDTNWRFYISEAADRYVEVNEPVKQFTSGTVSYMHACAAVMCTDSRDVLVNVITYFPSPIRIWINGELVLCGHSESIFKDTFFLCRLREGLNTVLVEQPLKPAHALSSQEFLVKMQPVERLLAHNAATAFFDPRFLAHLRRSVRLVPEVHETAPGEAVRVLVQPLSFGGDNAEAREAIRLRMIDSAGRCAAETDAAPNAVAVLPVPASARGVLRIEACAAADGSSLGSAYVSCGAAEHIAEQLAKEIAARPDLHQDVLHSVKGFAEVPQILKGLSQYVYREIRDELLETLFDAGRYAASAVRQKRVALEEVFPKRYTAFEAKSVDHGQFAYTVTLPDQYDPSRTYPAVVFFHDAQARLIPVPLPWTAWTSTSEAILISVVGIGRLNFADDLQVIRLIKQLLNRLPADRERIYGIGFCTGATKLYRIGMLVPHLFAGMASIIGEPRIDVHRPAYEHMENLGNTAVYGLSSVENWFYNSVRKRHALSLLEKARYFPIHGYMHNEFNALLNSKVLLDELLSHRLERYPRRIVYTMLDRACDSSFWLKDIEASDPGGEEPWIRAEWNDGSELVVRARNVSRFGVLIGKADAGCGEQITVTVNGARYPLSLVAAHGYLRVQLDADGGAAEMEMEGIKEKDYSERLTDITENAQALGIRKAYARRALIVKPDPASDPRRAFHIRLSYVQQNPMRDRYIPYQYRTCSESKLGEFDKDPVTPIYIMDLRNGSLRQKELLQRLGLRIDERAAVLDGRRADGEFALVRLCPDDDRDAVIAAYNSDASGDALLALWDTFDRNPLFYYDTLIWREGRWEGFSRLRGTNTIGKVEQL